MRRHRRVKILATLGPASSTEEMAGKLFEAGVDVFRLNMSHLPRARLAETVAMLRRVEAGFRRPLGILVDLQGPKLRVGTFADEAGVMLEEGGRFVLDDDTAPGDAARVHLPHPEILSALEAGHHLVLDDGKLKLVVENTDGRRAVTRVMVGGVLRSRKGLSLPDTVIPVSAMTEKDRGDAAFAAELGVDWIALSFVQRPEDIADLRAIVGRRVAILAKIEKPQAVQRLEEILEVADALMVARGDLGVEMPLEKVPGAQKRITSAARRVGKPVVVATQMLESMIAAPVPTRAEVSDVATAVFEGADAVMLSAESASGRYPLESVAMMNRIAEAVEADPDYRPLIDRQRAAPDFTGADALAASARQVSDTLRLKVICAWTASGSTVTRVARERPNAMILALTPCPGTARRLTLVWGVHPVRTRDASDIEDMALRAGKFATREGLSRAGQRISVIAGIPFGTPGATNVMKITQIPGE